MAKETMTEVLMPLMGEGITEATLVKWLKKPGELVKKEEPLLEVSTDKVDTEIPSPATGLLVQTFAADGETVDINTVIAHIAAEGAATAAAPVKTNEAPVAPVPVPVSGSAPAAPAEARKASAVPPSSDTVTGQSASSRPGANTAQATSGVSVGAATDTWPAQTPPSRPGATATSGKATATFASAATTALSEEDTLRRSSPLVRKIARSHDIDLAQVPGSGLHGRITKRDLAIFTSGDAQPLTSSQAPAGASGRSLPSVGGEARVRPGKTGGAHLEHGRLETKTQNGLELLDGVPVRREKMSRMRALIAEHMVRSVRTSPHVTTVFEIDLHRVHKAREQHKAAFVARTGFNLTYTAFFIHAAIQAIKQHPIINVSVVGEDILWKDEINVGVAVAIETGLIVPVIKNAGELNLLGVARRLNDLAVRARSKKLLPEDVQGGTFSITNPGMFGSIVSTPIINQPQVAIMSIGQVVKRPVVIDDMIAVRPLVQIGLTFDHRVIDGEGGARYLATLKRLLEEFDETVI